MFRIYHVNLIAKATTNMHTLKFRQTQAESPIYSGGNPISMLEEKYGLDPSEIYKLGSNENPLTTSDSVKNAISLALSGLNRYPPSVADLQENLAAYIGRGTNASNFVVGNGGCEILDLIAKSFINSGDEAIICPPTFPLYRLTLNRLEAKIIHANLNNDYSYNVDRILDSVTDKTRLLYLTTPNNPTGSVLTQDQQDEIMAKLPDHVLVVADEVYWQFNENEEMADSLRYVEEGRNIIVLHSFSKLFGLAGLRLGYGVAPTHISEYLKRGQLPFHLNTLSIAAGLAALGDRDHMEETISMTVAERPRIYQSLKEMGGIEVFPSETNFLLFKPEKDSKLVEEGLQKEGVIVRELSGFYMPGFIRVSVSQPHENNVFIEKLRKILE
ncbi:MAG: histidinol-phosphate aminotransferase [Cellvibrionaceae bacterium]|jgi:histidinol-phosphate aminotransferase